MTNDLYGWDNKITDLAQYRQSLAVKVAWKSNLLQNLDYLCSPENLPDDTLPLPNAIFHAKEFINELPLQIDAPTSDIEATGGVLLEWYKKELSEKITIFSVVLDGKGIIYSLYKEGKRTNNYGHLNFCKESIDKILPEITRHFGSEYGKQLKA